MSPPVQMLSFMHAQYSLFQQGYNLLDQIDPYMKKLAAEVRKVSPSTLFVLHHPARSLRPSGPLIGTGLTIDTGQLHNSAFRFFAG